MQTRQLDVLENRIAKLQAENLSLREKLTALKKENHQFQRALKDHRKLINSIPACIFLIQQGKIVDVNDVALQEFGYTAEELIGRDFLDLFHPDQRTSGRKLLRQWATGQVAAEEWEVAFVSKTNETLRCDARAKKIRFNGRTAVLGSLTRLEKRKRFESERIRAQKTEALTTMAGGLSRHLSPNLEVITENTKALQALMTPMNPEGMTSLANIETAVRELHRSVRKLNRFSDREPDPAAGPPFDLKKAVKEALALTAPDLKRATEERGIKIHLKTYLRSISPVVGDRDAIRDVLRHMIIHAVEAMPRGGELYLTTEENAGSAHIYIQDTGPGIPNRVKGLISNPFGTGKGIKRDGFGLSLAYAAVAGHQGDIELTSKRGQGTTINIRLPLAPQEPKPKTNLIRAKLRDARILIIEDQDMTRELLLQLLQNRGFMVDGAVSIPEGLKKLRRKKYDLIVSDAGMTDVHAGMVVRRMKALAPGVPIATLAAYGSGDTAKGIRGSEVDLVIARPIDMNKAIEQVSEVLIERLRHKAHPHVAETTRRKGP
jgi:PAS domain S-box-containing protein